MISLGGTVLSPHMLWSDEYDHSPVAQSKKMTIGGSMVLYNTQVIAGQNITLQALSDRGWLTKAMIDSVKAMASVVGATYTLVTHNGNYTVAFRHFDSPAVVASPILAKDVYTADDYFTATIKLVTV